MPHLSSRGGDGADGHHRSTSSRLQLVAPSIRATLRSKRQGVDKEAAAAALSLKCRQGEEPALRRAGGGDSGDDGVEQRTRGTNIDGAAG
jgi:hypothetical protein